MNKTIAALSSAAAVALVSIPLLAVAAQTVSAYSAPAARILTVAAR